MLTKGAIGNLVNRYRAVLRKCHLINVFGSLAVASMLVLGGAGVAEAGIVTKTDETLSDSVYGGGKYSSAGTHNVKNTGAELKNVTSSRYIFGGALLQGAGINYTGGSPENEAKNELASFVSIKDSSVTNSFIGGAGYIYNTGSSKSDATFYGASVDIENTNLENSTVFGGGYIYNGRTSTLEVTNTKVSIKGKLVVDTVIGGSFVNGTKSTATTLKTNATDIYLGEGVKVTNMVVGGHFSNWFGSNANVSETNIVIDGSDLSEAIVIGGNYFDTSSGQSQKITRVSDTGKTNITIKNSTLDSIYASDYSINNRADSPFSATTEAANLVIENSTIKGDVIGGSYIEGSQPATSDVTEAVSIVIKDSTVGGTITSDNLDHGEVKPNSIKDSTIDLTNVQAGEVAASKGTLYLRAYNGDTSGLQKITVSENVDVIVDVDGDSNDASGGDPTKAVSIGEGEYTATVTMAEGMYQGASSGTIENGVAKMKKSTSSVMSNVLDIASSQALTINRILMNDVRKRLGDIRSDEGTHGAWMRYDGGSFSGSHGYENDFTTFQLGVDTKPVEGAPRFGMAFAYTNSDADMKRGGAEMDAFSFAAYATKMYDNGLFVDVIGRVASADTEVVIDGNKKGSLDTLALSVSGELGWRANITDRFYLEPQAELTYTYVNSDSLTLNSGHAYDFDAVDSLIGRLGVAAGVKLPDNLGDVYVRASVVSEFLGEATVRGGNNVHSVDGDDTWLEYGIGANVKLTDKTYIWADVERTEGADIEEEWRGTVGLRYSF